MIWSWSAKWMEFKRLAVLIRDFKNRRAAIEGSDQISLIANHAGSHSAHRDSIALLIHLRRTRHI
jgi:hypothetical protein